jgi:hypothetical protein
LLDVPLERVRGVTADEQPVRLELVREGPQLEAGSMLLRRQRGSLLVSVEHAAGLSDVRTLVLLEGTLLRGARGLRARLPSDFDQRSQGLAFSCGFSGERGGRREAAALVRGPAAGGGFGRSRAALLARRRGLGRIGPRLARPVSCRYARASERGSQPISSRRRALRKGGGAVPQARRRARHASGRAGLRGLALSALVLGSFGALKAKTGWFFIVPASVACFVLAARRAARSLGAGLPHAVPQRGSGPARGP